MRPPLPVTPCLTMFPWNPFTGTAGCILMALTALLLAPLCSPITGIIPTTIHHQVCPPLPLSVLQRTLEAPPMDPPPAAPPEPNQSRHQHRPQLSCLEIVNPTTIPPEQTAPCLVSTTPFPATLGHQAVLPRPALALTGPPGWDLKDGTMFVARPLVLPTAVVRHPTHPIEPVSCALLSTAVVARAVMATLVPLAPVATDGHRMVHLPMAVAVTVVVEAAATLFSTATKFLR